jgi:hypothetical protein
MKGKRNRELAAMTVRIGSMIFEHIPNLYEAGCRCCHCAGVWAIRGIGTDEEFGFDVALRAYLEELGIAEPEADDLDLEPDTPYAKANREIELAQVKMVSIRSQFRIRDQAFSACECTEKFHRCQHSGGRSEFSSSPPSHTIEPSILSAADQLEIESPDAMTENDERSLIVLGWKDGREPSSWSKVTVGTFPDGIRFGRSLWRRPAR